MIRLGMVVGTHPEDHSVDLVMVDDLAKIPRVQVLSPAASTDSGMAGLIQPDRPSADYYDPKRSNTRDVMAVCAPMGRNLVVLGFLHPQISQVLFKDGRWVHRHPSDFYSTIDSHGNFEAAHPSGTYLRIGTSTAHEDLTGKDFDGNWTIVRNRAAAVGVRVEVANGGSTKAAAEIAADGTLTLGNAAGGLTIRPDGRVEITGSALSLQADSILFDGEVAITKDLTVSGFIQSMKDVFAGLVSLLTHVTTGVKSGTDVSGPPAPS